MCTDWKTACRAAIREQDQRKLFPRCDRARRAMRERESELGTSRRDVRESEQMGRARRRLEVHAAKHLMIAALSKEDRRSTRRSIDGPLFTLQQCGGYLRDYAAGSQNVAKCLHLIYCAEESLNKIRIDLMEKHKFTDSPKG